jgi:hypothetical protein
MYCLFRLINFCRGHGPSSFLKKKSSKEWGPLGTSSPIKDKEHCWLLDGIIACLEIFRVPQVVMTPAKLKFRLKNKKKTNNPIIFTSTVILLQGLCWYIATGTQHFTKVIQVCHVCCSMKKYMMF